MGAIWAVLLVVGTVAPTLILAGSAWLVHRLATRLLRLHPTSRPAWQWVVGHVAFVTVVEGVAAGLLGVFGPGITVVLPATLGSLSMVVAPIYLYRRIRIERADQPEVVSVTPEPERAGPPLRLRAPERRWGVAVLFALTGVLLPWVVGLGVKVYLDSQGRPTLPISDFTDPEALPILLIQTVTLWAFPFLVLASAVVVPWRVGFGTDPNGRESMLPIWLAFAGGVLGDLLMFVGIFWEFDAIMLIVPLGSYLLPPMIAGYVIGWWVVRRRNHWGRHGASPLILLVLAFLAAGSCAPVPSREAWVSEMYSNPLVLPGTGLLVLEGRVPPRNPEIFTARRDGSELRNLTGDPGMDIMPVGSPDGRWILFVSDREDRDGAEALYRMASDGSATTKLADGASGLSYIGWIPGGRDVVYATREGIMIVAGDGSGEPRLFVPGASDPLWSPDGRWMLYQGGRRGTELHVVSDDGSSDRKLAEGWALTWLPDAGALLFHTTGSRHALSDVYRIRTDGSGLERIMTDVLLSGRGADPSQAWSPDGTRLALPAADVGGLRSRDGIVVLDRAGRLLRDLRKRQEFLHDGTLTWLDNRTVVLSKLYNPGRLEFGLSRDPGGIYLLDVESGEERRIVPNAEILVDPDRPPW